MINDIRWLANKLWASIPRILMVLAASWTFSEIGFTQGLLILSIPVYSHLHKFLFGDKIKDAPDDIFSFRNMSTLDFIKEIDEGGESTV